MKELCAPVSTRSDARARPLSDLALRLYTAYYWVAAFAWMSVIATLTLILVPLVGYPWVHQWIAAPGFRRCLSLGFHRITIHYDPQFDPHRPSVFCQNHINLLDAYVAAASIPNVFCGLMHAWQFKIPIYGWMMHLSKGIRVYPDRSDNVSRITAQALQRRKMGFSILTFPEGGRTRTGKVSRFRRGVFRMAREAGYPVVPIAVKGNYEINRKGTLLFQPFGNIVVHVGPQIETQGVADEHLDMLAERARDYIVHHTEVTL